MIAIEELARLYDEAIRSDCEPLPNGTALSARASDAYVRPTAKSLVHIQSKLGVTLPPSLVEFASLSYCYDQGFAGLGEDYTHPHHILEQFSRTRRLRGRRDGRWCYLKPASLIPIDLGFDGDYSCLDVLSPTVFDGEHGICYWCASMSSGCSYSWDFRGHILKIVLHLTQPEGSSSWKKSTKRMALHERATAVMAVHDADVLAALVQKP